MEIPLIDIRYSTEIVTCFTMGHYFFYIYPNPMI